MKKFRYKSSINVPYTRQGAITFMMLRYDTLPDAKKRRVEALCKKAGGSTWKALFEYLTTDADPGDVMKKHYIASYTTLGRGIKRFMEGFPDDLL